MHRFYMVWGDLKDRGGDGQIALRADFDGETAKSFVSLERTFALVKMGPTTVTGTLVADSYTDEINEFVIYVSFLIPDWIVEGVHLDWGWEKTEGGYPPPRRFPFAVDTLLLSNGAGHNQDMFQGWSAPLWLDSGVRPLQRLPIVVDERTGKWVSTRVLDCGTSGQGIGYAVLYTPDSHAVQRLHLERSGWLREPWLQVKERQWRALVDMSDAVETHVVTVLRNPIVVNVTIHSVLGIPDEVLPVLPRDVRDELEKALLDLPDPSDWDPDTTF